MSPTCRADMSRHVGDRHKCLSFGGCSRQTQIPTLPAKSQNQFCYYWDAGSKNWADYHTKHHPDTYHDVHRIPHAGIWEVPGQ